MHLEKYNIEAASSLLRFEFYSTGPKGSIKKQVAFKPFENNPTVYNIGFGDVDNEGNINDLSITNNADSQKVLATVALSIIRFFEKYPSTFVYATGSTKSRTRLYRIGISNNLSEIETLFEIYGYMNNAWVKFEKGVEYEAFLVKPLRKEK